MFPCVDPLGSDSSEAKAKDWAVAWFLELGVGT